MLMLLACTGSSPALQPARAVDGDGDGYTTAFDCNDADPDVSPAARELCDLADVDEDCDGLVDDADPTTATHDKGPAYPDEDGDGWGTGTVPTAVCDLLAGFAAYSGDCDDDDAAVNPGTTEVCQDGVDNNCDGLADGCGPWGIGGPANADAVFLGEGSSDGFGSSCVNAGDVDGDGRDDVLFGAVSAGSGAAYLVTDALAGDFPVADAPYQIVGSTELDGTGFAVAGGGDGDGDGVPDLLVGAIAELGPAILFFSGADLVPGVRDAATADAKLREGTGFSVCEWNFTWAGDTDGDGTDDLVCAAETDQTAGEVAGAVFAFLGPLEGELSLGDAITMYGGEARGAAGRSLAGLGDVDGDGLEDLVVGAFTDGREIFQAGAALLVHGPMREDGLADPDAVLLGEDHEQWAGWYVAAAGDPDGDGRTDVLVANAYSVVYVVDGATTGTVSLADSMSILMGESGSSAGSRMGAAGDVDGDGSSDVLVGAPGLDRTYSEQGGAYVVRAPLVSQELERADDQLLGPDGGFDFGSAVAGVGDVDGDGFAEIAIGQTIPDGYGTGAVFIYRGGPGL